MDTVQIVADTIQTVIDTIQNIGCTLQQPIVNEVQVHLETKSSTLEIIIEVFTAVASIMASFLAFYSARTSKRISEQSLEISKLANDRVNKYQNGARLDLNVIPYSDEEITDYCLEKVVIENNGLCSARNVIVKTVSTDDCFFDPPHPIINCVDDRKNSDYTTSNISPNETVELILGHQGFNKDGVKTELEIEWDDDYQEHNTKKVSI